MLEIEKMWTKNLKMNETNNVLVYLRMNSKRRKKNPENNKIPNV